MPKRLTSIILSVGDPAYQASRSSLIALDSKYDRLSETERCSTSYFMAPSLTPSNAHQSHPIANVKGRWLLPVTGSLPRLAWKGLCVHTYSHLQFDSWQGRTALNLKPFAMISALTKNEQHSDVYSAWYVFCTHLFCC